MLHCLEVEFPVVSPCFGQAHCSSGAGGERRASAVSVWEQSNLGFTTGTDEAKTTTPTVKYSVFTKPSFH